MPSLTTSTLPPAPARPATGGGGQDLPAHPTIKEFLGVRPATRGARRRVPDPQNFLDPQYSLIPTNSLIVVGEEGADRAGLGHTGGQLGVRRVDHVFQHEPVRRHDRDPGVPDAGSEHLRGQPAGRRPSPTAATAPTSARTIEWQKASATTRATTKPSASRSQPVLEQGADRRRALAPPAERRRSRAARPAAPRGRVHRLDVQRARPGHHVGPPQRRHAAGVVAQPVGVAAAQRGEPGVEARRCGRRAVHPDVGGQDAAQPPDERRSGRRSERPGNPSHAGSGTSTWHTCPVACTPASVRPATTSGRSSSAPAAPWPAPPSGRPATVRRPGCTAQPEKPVPS